MAGKAGGITTVSFDGDDTLWDFDKAMRPALSHTLAELRRLVPGAADTLSVETMIAIRDRVAGELRGKVIALEKVRLAAFERTLEHVGIHDADLAAHLCAVYLKRRFEEVELFDDTLPTLDAIQGRHTVGLLSNGNTYPERCGLEGRFQFVVFSQEYGVEKPDPRLFRIAMEQAGCSERELLHVGDSLADDVGGAKRAGARSVWLNRKRRRNESGIKPDFEISSLSELAEICEKLA
jgi:HAD superfamily hydrolase (TIGR01549 family)